MSNETRTMMVVLVVCGFLMLACIGIPAGVGAVLFFRLSQEAKMAEAQVRQAMVAERQARDQFEAIRQKEESTAVAPPATAGIPPIPAPPGAPNLTPPIPIPPGLARIDLNDTEQRKSVYRSIKTTRELAQQLEQGLAQLADVSGDANLQGAIADAKKKTQDQQLDHISNLYGITRKQLDEIIAQGDKEGW